MEKVLPSEAVYGFAAWVSSKDELIGTPLEQCALLAEWVQEYCMVNNFESPREGVYPKNLEYPK